MIQQIGTTISIDKIRYVKEFQPRLTVDDAWIEQLRTALDRLPPIIVARGGVLVDGYHRWQAHKRDGAGFIDVIDLGDITDDEIFQEAVRRNATPGKQLSIKEKREIAAKRYPLMNPSTAVADLAEWLSVDERTIQRWTKDARAELAEQRRAAAWSLWLDCLTQEEIAERLGEKQQRISDWISTGKRQLVESGTDLPSGATDEKPWGNIQHFDIWSFPTADKGDGQQSYFGAIPPQVVENLFWFWTEPGQIVVDLFAGSGTVIDVAKRMGRRVWASDLQGDTYAPHLRIHRHDATAGWPEGAPRRADLVILDPPYWQQAKARYSADDRDLGNRTLGEFYTDWAAVVKTATGHTDRIAYIISPTQVENGCVIDHATDMLAPFLDEGWRVQRRVIVPWPGQLVTGQQVTWARDNKRLLKLYRDLVIMTR